MSARIRYGIIGCGSIGTTHADALALLEEADLVAVCDLDRTKAQAVADKHGIEHVFTSFEEMLDSVQLDAVSVATDHKSHFAPAMAAIRRRVHVIVEKPITHSLEQAHELVTAAEEHGVKLGGVFQRRFFPSAQRMRAAIEEGRLGRIVIAECIAHLGRDRAYFDSADWRGTWRGEGGGVLMNQAVHMVDMLLWMVGTPTEVYGRWDLLKHGDYIDVEDVAAGVVAFEGGALATIQATTAFENGITVDPSSPTSRRAPGFRLAVHGTSGHSVGMAESPELMQATTDQWTFDGEDGFLPEWFAAEGGRYGFPAFHSDQLRDFALAVLEDRQPTVTGLDAYRALEVVKGVYLAHDRRRPVALPMTAEDREAADRLTSGERE
ncbi:Gfo/Idh/MocA family protein [Naasia sp. SYSU D00948]|uniref:Gfo/Idh/MocA family protein n=1 Tax=Naasia sp. SYSU D00948 TaxID=2817379 RepID=UPI001B3041AF|nr:Gfo/Idh/MocA family oxidoreductase [Naasia sp. SYSU D00948]